jgi:hypothetical protein
MAVLRRNVHRRGDVLVVLRFLATGKPACSRPCELCQQKLLDSGLKKIIYFDENGCLTKATINQLYDGPNTRAVLVGESTIKAMRARGVKLPG